MNFKRNIDRAFALVRCRAEGLVRGQTSGKDSRDPSARRQILVDVSELVRNDAGTGIPRVTKRILQELVQLAPAAGFDVRPVYAKTFRYGYRYAAKVSDVFACHDRRDVNELISFKAGDVFLGLDLHHYVVRNQRPFYDMLHTRGIKVFFVVYDLLPIQFPECFEHPSEGIHAKWLRTLCRYDGALCISDSVADELRKWIRDKKVKVGPDFKISSFRLGSDFRRVSVEETGQLSHRDRAGAVNFLVVGTLEPRKCHRQILEAFDILWADGIDVTLTFVGRPGWKTKPLVRSIENHSLLNKRFKWLEGATDDQLETIYQQSDCLIAASMGEGFGLPIVEAAQRAVLVIARDIPVFREVAGQGAHYFSGSTADDLAAAIRAWLSLYAQGSAPKPHHVHRTSWLESAKQILSVVDKRFWVQDVCTTA